ncbi:MAG: thiamine phosphate synthase [Rudaea sp.]
MEPISARRAARAARIAGLYAVTPDLADTGTLAAKVAAALDGGASVVQYRNKSASAELRRAQAQALARVHALRGGLYVVNDDPMLAVDVDADGVHLGLDDPDLADARRVMGPDRLIGVSCYDSLARARAAVAAGADYVAFGSFFASSVKPAARHADTSLLAHAHELGVPIVAIGGITSGNAAALIEAGASATAVISDVFAHGDPADVARAAQAFEALFRRARAKGTA